MKISRTIRAVVKVCGTVGRFDLDRVLFERDAEHMYVTACDGRALVRVRFACPGGVPGRALVNGGILYDALESQAYDRAVDDESLDVHVYGSVYVEIVDDGLRIRDVDRTMTIATGGKYPLVDEIVSVATTKATAAPIGVDPRRLAPLLSVFSELDLDYVRLTTGNSSEAIRIEGHGQGADVVGVLMPCLSDATELWNGIGPAKEPS